MKINIEELQRAVAQAKEQSKGKTADELLEIAAQHHHEVIRNSIKAGYHFKAILLIDGASKLSDLAARHDMSELLFYAEIKVYEEAERLAQTGIDTEEVIRQVGLSSAYERYEALRFRELSTAIERATQ